MMLSLGAVLSGVYPRVCGGTLNGSTIATVEAGLSPRVRGNPDRSPTSV